MAAGHVAVLAGTMLVAGGVVWNAALVFWLVTDVLAAGEQDEPGVWPDPMSVSVWTGNDWFTVTVMEVAFGRWGVAVCRQPSPCRASPIELVDRVGTEQEARDRARRLVGRALNEDRGDTVVSPCWPFRTG